MVAELGTLQKVLVREHWTHEEHGFTPWLAEEKNLALLGDALGLELEFEAKEKPVGSYYADILAKDTATGKYVVIENQLEKTDRKSTRLNSSHANISYAV